MRQQRSLVVASIGFIVALVAAAPIAYVALGNAFSPVPLRAPRPALAAAAPMALPRAPLAARGRSRPRHVASRATRSPSAIRSTIIPAPEQVARTIIPARPRPTSTLPILARARPTTTPHRRHSERIARATLRTAHVPAAAPRSTPPAPTASIAAVQDPMSAKDIRKALKRSEKVQKAMEKALRRESKHGVSTPEPREDVNNQDG